MKIPILAYQPMRIHGNEYRNNQVRALAADLRQLTDAGFKVVALRTLVDAWLANRGLDLDARLVALTADNGADFDYVDLPHPSCGTQRSVINILRDFAAERPGAQDGLNVTSFVIASPEARAALDAACMVGKGWWNDGWWKDAIASGLIHIGNHSWDHNHEALPASFGRGARRGSFASILNADLADHEILQAAAYLREHAPNPGAALFAYPYGEANHYLTHEYFPSRGEELGIAAAFTARARFLERGCSRWEIPRFVSGRDWNSPAELAAILDAASQAGKAWVPVRRPSSSAETAPSGAPRVAKDHAAQGSAMSKEQFWKFLHERVEPIEGWLHPEAALLTAHLANVQVTWGIAGPMLEIGVYKGKYLSVLYSLLQADERLVGVDLFVGAGNVKKAAELVRSNITQACGDNRRLKMLVADSMELTSGKLADRAGASRFRLISVDAGHTRELVRRDLETAYPLLAKGGIMALDDAFNFGTPGVIEGITEFFRGSEPALAPFAVCYNKLFVTTPDFHARCLRETLAFLDEITWLSTRERTLKLRRENQAGNFTPSLFGYEVVPFT